MYFLLIISYDIILKSAGISAIYVRVICVVNGGVSDDSVMQRMRDCLNP
jgi:hypothetical protein